jgi:hypothetical protein
LKNVKDRVKKELAILVLPPTQIALALSGGSGREPPLDKKLCCPELDEGCGFYYQSRDDVQPLLAFREELEGMGIVVERDEDLWIHAEGSQEELDMSVSVDEDFESYPKRSLTPHSL